MEQILQQAPPGITQEYIEPIWEKYKGNVANILAELWNVEETPKQSKNLSIEDMKIKKKFTEIRELCDEFDAEMDKQLDIIRQQKFSKPVQPAQPTEQEPST